MHAQHLKTTNVTLLDRKKKHDDCDARLSFSCHHSLLIVALLLLTSFILSAVSRGKVPAEFFVCVFQEGHVGGNPPSQKGYIPTGSRGKEEMDRHANYEDGLREELLPSRNIVGLERAGVRLAPTLPYNAPTPIGSDMDLPGNLVEYLDLKTPLPTDRKFREIMSGVERSLVEDVRGNAASEEHGGAAYCFVILVYTTTIGILVWFNPEIRLGWLLLAPLPLYIPCGIRWWRHQHGAGRLATVDDNDDAYSNIPIR